jgi:hypothetical protein
MKVCIDLTFEVVGEVSLEAGEKLRFPRLPALPGVYRFRFLSNPVSTYIGETENLQRRSRQYSVPGPRQQTNIRIHALLRRHLEGGGVVEFATVPSATVTLGEETAPIDFSQQSHRRLVENAALISNPKSELIENLL